MDYKFLDETIILYMEEKFRNILSSRYGTMEI